MAGYSGTPLPKKLGIVDASTVAIIGEPPDTLAAEGIVVRDSTARYDVVLACVQTQTEFSEGLASWSEMITANGYLWICWPKKTAWRLPAFRGADMTEDLVRLHALPMGLVDNKVCAIDEYWSALRLVWRVELRASKQ